MCGFVQAETSDISARLNQTNDARLELESTVAELQAEHKSLIAESLELTPRHRAQEAQTLLRSEIADAQSKLEEERAGYEAALSSLTPRAGKIDAQNRLEAYERDLETANSKLRDAHNEADAARRDLHEAQRQLDEERQLSLKQQNELESVSNQSVQIAEQELRIESQGARLQSLLQTEHDALANAEALRHELIQQQESSQQHAEAQQKEDNNTSSAMEATEVAIHHTEEVQHQQIVSLKAELASAQAQLAETQSTMAEATEIHMKELSHALQVMREQGEIADAVAQQTETELARAKDNVNHLSQALETAQLAASNQSVEVQQTIANLRSRHSIAETEASDLRRALSVAEKELTTARAQIADLQQLGLADKNTSEDHDDVHARLVDAEARCQELGTAVDQCEVALATYRTKNGIVLSGLQDSPLAPLTGIYFPVKSDGQPDATNGPSLVFQRQHLSWNQVIYLYFQSDRWYVSPNLGTRSGYLMGRLSPTLQGDSISGKPLPPDPTRREIEWFQYAGQWDRAGEDFACRPSPLSRESQEIIDFERQRVESLSAKLQEYEGAERSMGDSQLQPVAETDQADGYTVPRVDPQKRSSNPTDADATDSGVDQTATEVSITAMHQAFDDLGISAESNQSAAAALAQLSPVAQRTHEAATAAKKSHVAVGDADSVDQDDLGASQKLESSVDYGDFESDSDASSADENVKSQTEPATHGINSDDEMDSHIDKRMDTMNKLYGDLQQSGEIGNVADHDFVDATPSADLSKDSADSRSEGDETAQSTHNDVGEESFVESDMSDTIVTADLAPDDRSLSAASLKTHMEALVPKSIVPEQSKQPQQAFGHSTAGHPPQEAKTESAEVVASSAKSHAPPRDAPRSTSRPRPPPGPPSSTSAPNTGARSRKKKPRPPSKPPTPGMGSRPSSSTHLRRSSATAPPRPPSHDARSRRSLGSSRRNNGPRPPAPPSTGRRRAPAHAPLSARVSSSAVHRTNLFNKACP